MEVLDLEEMVDLVSELVVVEEEVVELRPVTQL